MALVPPSRSPSIRPTGIDPIVDRHGPWLLSWFRRRAPRGSDPEDLAQESLLVLCRRPEIAGDPEGAGRYLLEVARRVLMAARRRARGGGPGPLSEDPPDRSDRAPTGAGARPELERLSRAVGDLPDELQQVIDVVYSRSLTYEQAAGLLGVPRSTIQSRLRRALALLRRRMTPEADER